MSSLEWYIGDLTATHCEENMLDGIFLRHKNGIRPDNMALDWTEHHLLSFRALGQRRRRRTAGSGWRCPGVTDPWEKRLRSRGPSSCLPTSVDRVSLAVLQAGAESRGLARHRRGSRARVCRRSGRPALPSGVRRHRSFKGGERSGWGRRVPPSGPLRGEGPLPRSPGTHGPALSLWGPGGLGGRADPMRRDVTLE
ncbi:hypothetical protein NDU88_007034 [Pleurodeles waltl]|uniref:Uncharacterized protein n=1 Tax=Pleurodeles waltl TaxID=8319 RepID=A0AAV7VPB2_PLEWA|nr:hypothetical protein NDU88_007034 [Pleurodeles waltl]